jgi:hypothetical protein
MCTACYTNAVSMLISEERSFAVCISASINELHVSALMMSCCISMSVGPCNLVQPALHSLAGAQRGPCRSYDVRWDD